MDKSEAIKALRNLADALELSDVSGDMSIDLKRYDHLNNVTDRDEIKRWAHFMSNPAYGSNTGTHWIKGDVAGAKVTVFFEPHHVLGTVEDAIADLLPAPVEAEPATP